MRKLLFGSLFVLALSGLVLAQSDTDLAIPSPYHVGYVRLQPQPVNSQNSTVDFDANPQLAPGATPNHGQSIVGNPGGLPGVLSVPNFSRSFTAYGQTYPFTMVGNEPSLGHTTFVPVNFLPVSLELMNSDGSIFATVPVQQYLDLTMNSPNFVDAEYETGHGQFADAVQRAEFYNSMKQNWHTQLQPVRIVDQVTVQVPPTVRVNIGGRNLTVHTYRVEFAPDGETVVLMLNLYLEQVLLPTVVNNEINAGNLTTDGINILLLPNTYLFEVNRRGTPSACCILGFHEYFYDPGASPEPRWLTIFASWVAPDYFDGGLADVSALSHEISETLNDPFVNNAVPGWQYPNAPNVCQYNLETGDPLETTDSLVFPMPMKVQSLDFIFHPQNEALLQWFEQLDVSDAYDGAYSYPYEGVLTAPATPCP